MSLFSRFQSEECDHEWKEIDTSQGIRQLDAEKDILRVFETVHYQCENCPKRNYESNARVKKTYKLTEAESEPEIIRMCENFF